MAAAVFFICSDPCGHHERATAHCGLHQRRTAAYCAGCGEHLWDADHACR